MNDGNMNGINGRSLGGDVDGATAPYLDFVLKVIKCSQQAQSVNFAFNILVSKVIDGVKHYKYQYASPNNHLLLQEEFLVYNNESAKELVRLLDGMNLYHEIL